MRNVPQAGARGPGQHSDSRGGARPRSAGDELVEWVMGGAVLSWALALLIWQAGTLDARQLLLAKGVISFWRYGWGAMHVARALIYLGLVMPVLLRRARAADLASIGHVYGVVCSYGILPNQFRAVYEALLDNCLACGLPATIVASVTSDADCALLAECLRRRGSPAGIEIVVQFQDGSGKRNAIGMALRAIARRHPPPGSVTLMVDGDVVLAPGALAECCRFMAADPGLGALTTNNDGMFRPDDAARHWYRLRFAQRHLTMCSLALSERVLVLTGRFSVYRTRHLADPQCIAAVEGDAMQHWLHGTIPLLSGDDKSLWLQMVRQGLRMRYLPHVKAVSFESLPRGTGMLAGSTQLMLRWLGNMVRANGQALALGPRRCGLFLWWCLVDQRFSVVTVLLGLAVATCLAVTVAPIYLPLYLSWVVVSRSLLAAVYGALWGGFHPCWPVALAYGQLWGGLLKFYLFCRPDRQSWTRQRISSRSSTAISRAAGNTLFVLLVAGIVGLAALITKVGFGGGA